MFTWFAQLRSKIWATTVTEKHPARSNLLVPNNIYMSTANTIIRPIGTILSTERHLCVAFNKGKKKVQEQRVQGKEGVPTEKDSQSKSDKASGTEVERFGVIKKWISRSKKCGEQRWRFLNRCGEQVKRWKMKISHIIQCWWKIQS